GPPIRKPLQVCVALVRAPISESSKPGCPPRPRGRPWQAARFRAKENPMAVPNLQELTFRLNRAGGGLVNPIVFTRNGDGMIEGLANMFGYKPGKVDLLDKHQDFLHTLFTNVLNEDSLSTVRFIGRADRKNRSGNVAVNQKISDDRALRAENFM